ncbi:MAG: ATP-binding protein [Paludibacteraceae bacterium]
MFKEFYRNSDSENVKGHGVGLSFTKQIIKAHNGKIHIENKRDNPTKGTTFVVELMISPLEKVI